MFNEQGGRARRQYEVLADPMTTAAAIDRLVHHSVILELNLPSYRLEEAKRGNETRWTGGEQRA